MIHVLGATGMLGRYVYTFLKYKARMDVTAVTRTKLDAQNITKLGLLDLHICEGDVVINCVGLIKQHNDIEELDFVLVNTTFPHIMSDHCTVMGAKFIQASTDCVFNGLEGHYDEGSIHTATDMYGRSKSLGEPSKATCIRTSIIGEELHNKVSLFEWVRSNKGKTVKGYTNHYWNGITCLQFAKICTYMIVANNYWEGVKHIFSPTPVNKYELISTLSYVYDLDITVEPFKTASVCNRLLCSTRSDVALDIITPGLLEQIQDMKTYGDTLRRDDE